MKPIISLIAVLSAFQLFATHYYVSPLGDDENSGESRRDAFVTVQRGVSSLKPGDTLVVMPGEYHEAVSAYLSGTPDAPIVIKAEKPGTAILRGDVPLPKNDGFTLVDQDNGVYVTDFNASLQGVGERDTFTLYKRYEDIAYMKNAAASYHHDATAGKLYVRTSDGRPPSEHLITVSDIEGCGLFLGRKEKTLSESIKVRNVIVDGLIVTGFRSSNYRRPKINDPAGGGIVLTAPDQCAIRNCVAFFCDYGIEMRGFWLNADSGFSRGAEGWLEHFKKAVVQRGVNQCVIEDCRAYANYAHYSSSHGDFAILGLSKDSAIRDCVAIGGEKGLMSVRFYSGYHENSVIENNVTWNTFGIWSKSNLRHGSLRFTGNIADRFGIYQKHMVTPGPVVSNNMSFGARAPQSKLGIPALAMGTKKITQLAKDFAAPLLLDFRLQSDSQYRGSGLEPRAYEENHVFFVSPSGDDGNAGTSVALAWKTLANAVQAAPNGATVYLTSGTYPERLEIVGKRDVSFKRRSLGDVKVEGVTIDACVDVEARGVTVFQPSGEAAILVKDSDGVTITHCVAANAEAGLAVENANNVSVWHCAFVNNQRGVDASDSTSLEIAANMFSGNECCPIALAGTSLQKGLFCDYNCYDDAERVVVERGWLFSWFDAIHSLTDWRNHHFGRHSIIATPMFKAPRNGDFHLENARLFNGRSPLGTPIGPWNRISAPTSDLEPAVKVHSSTPTSVNVEWKTHGVPTYGKLEWGENKRCEKDVALKKDYLDPIHRSSFHSLSVIGLKPGAEYYCRGVTGMPLKEFYSYASPDSALGGEAYVELRSPLIPFETPSEERASKTYHVSIEGDDANDGLTTAAAWRTLRKAVAVAMPGDTVLVGDGAYDGGLVIKNTGTRERRITFKAVHPGKAFIDSKTVSPTCFTMDFKSFITLDGFYMRNCHSSGLYGNIFSGYLDVFGGEGVIVKRCLVDGRAKGFKTLCIFAECRDLVVENSVLRNGWGLLTDYDCRGLVLRNNVFYGALVNDMTLHGDAVLSHNVICAQVPKKRLNQLTSVDDLNMIKDEYNCYFTRLAPDKKAIYKIDNPYKKYTLDEFYRLTGQPKTSFFANPGMKILPEFLIRKDHLEGRPHPYVTQELQMKSVERNGEKVKEPIIEPFEAFFATNPKCAEADDGQPIGLDPEVFSEKRESESDASGDDEYPCENRNEPEEAP